MVHEVSLVGFRPTALKAPRLTRPGDRERDFLLMSNTFTSLQAFSSSLTLKRLWTCVRERRGWNHHERFILSSWFSSWIAHERFQHAGASCGPTKEKDTRPQELAMADTKKGTQSAKPVHRHLLLCNTAFGKGPLRGPGRVREEVMKACVTAVHHFLLLTWEPRLRPSCSLTLFPLPLLYLHNKEEKGRRWASLGSHPSVSSWALLLPSLFHLLGPKNK